MDTNYCTCTHAHTHTHTHTHTYTHTHGHTHTLLHTLTTAHVRVLVELCLLSMKHKVEKASLFSLGEEDLTHYGQSLAEMDDFDQLDVLSDSDEDDREGECEGHM